MNKKERIAVVERIGDLLDHYCKVCPYQGGMIRSTVCSTCPIAVELEKQGNLLYKRKVVTVTPKELGKPDAKRWTKTEEKRLKELHGIRTISEIAFEFERSYSSVCNRISVLKQRGEIEDASHAGATNHIF
ncbi:hypothetical protein [Sporosarcina sp. FSL W7-1283]|uniref:hypothetical protein n=1 Tax=Sporosarcina sp. FSL W7-1283 TaxID=2921560 RepID=UPI0030FC72FD